MSKSLHIQIFLASPAGRTSSPRGNLPSHSGASSKLPAPGKLPKRFLNFSKGNEGGKTEQGPATQALRNPCTRIQLLKPSSCSFHMHCHLSHCKKGLFSLSNQQQLLIQWKKLKYTYIITHTQGTCQRPESTGVRATHTTNNPEYASCPTNLLCFLQPLFTGTLRANHILASLPPCLPACKHFPFH